MGFFNRKKQKQNILYINNLNNQQKEININSFVANLGGISNFKKVEHENINLIIYFKNSSKIKIKYFREHKNIINLFLDSEKKIITLSLGKGVDTIADYLNNLI